MKFVNDFLNNITMYRLMLWGLLILALIAMVFGFFGLVGYSAFSMIVSLIVLFAACMISNALFAKLWKAPRNVESVYITALILFFVLAPFSSLIDLLLLALAGVIAMASKYVLAIRKKHIFNPAAISAAILGLFGGSFAIWWVATLWLLVPTAIFVFLILKKIRRFSLFVSFALTSIAALLLLPLLHVSVNISSFSTLILSYPLLFLGGIMLTEPLTAPGTRNLQIAYGIIVGLLFEIQFHFGPVFSTPEIALVLGNVFSYLVSSKDKVRLAFVSAKKFSENVYDFVFSSDKKFVFKPGQYAEWTLEHTPSDSRGNRRYFTIASSPTEPQVHLGIRFDMAQGSSFKKKLLDMKPGETLMTSGFAGDFTLPRDTSKKLVWVAGGIGITPFRSQMQYLSDVGEKRDVVLVYAVLTPKDFAYKEEIERAKNTFGMKVVYVVNDARGEIWNGRTGYITEKMLVDDVPNLESRDFYVSGPPKMVDHVKGLLYGLHIHRKQIHTDYFPGY